MVFAAARSRIAKGILALGAFGIAAGAVWAVFGLRLESLGAGERFAIPCLRPLAGTEPRPDETGADETRLYILIRPSCAICREEIASLERHLPEDGRARIRIVAFGSRKEAATALRGFPRAAALTAVDESGVLESTYGRFRVPTLLVVSDRVVRRKVRGRAEGASELLAEFAASVPKRTERGGVK